MSQKPKQLDLEHPIAPLKGAEYNPRRISQADLDVLAQSITRLGMVKPVIARNNLIVAGHQRTKAMRALGRTHAPVFRLEQKTTTYDEVRFNQLHNGTDMDCGDEACTVEGGFDEADLKSFVFVDPKRIKGNYRGQLANVRSEICALIQRFGPWGGVVCTQSGDVIHCAQYALASALTRQTMTAYVIPDAERKEYEGFLNKAYGQFSYEKIERKTYIQSFAQMYRLRGNEEDGRKQNHSTVYTTMVLPWLQNHPDAAILDFGSGQGDYAKRLRNQGYDHYEIEFFRRIGADSVIDTRSVHRMIESVLLRLRGHGRFDAVVCDSVLNSIDSLEAEAAVMTTLNAMAKPGAHVFFSGRHQDRVAGAARSTKDASRARSVEFLDENGMTALYRKGQWFFQKFHNDSQVAALAEAAGLEIVNYQKRTNVFQATCIKRRELDPDQVMKAIDFEFNLPWPNNHRVDRHNQMKSALGLV